MDSLRRNGKELIKSDNNNNNHDSKNINKAPFWGFGILSLLFGCVIDGLIALCVKWIYSTVAIEKAGFRCNIQLLILLPVVTYKCYKGNMQITGPPGKFVLLIMRGFIGCVAVICLFEAYDRIPVGDAATIAASNVIFSAFLAYFFLGEPITILDGLFSVSTILGIILIAKPTFIFNAAGLQYTTENVVGIIFAVLSAFFLSSSFILVRKLGNETHALLNVLYYSIAGTVTSSAYLGISGEFTYPCTSELVYVFLLGFLGLTAQMALTLALQYERASTCSVLRSFLIVIVFIFQTTILNDIPTTLSICGASIIFVSVIGIGLRKVYKQRKTNKTQ